jgi:beta-lactamase class A
MAGGGAALAAESLRRLARRFSGTLAVASRSEDTGELLTFDPDRVMPTASVIKLAVLAEVFRQDSVGSLSLDERIILDEGNRVGGSGVLKDLSPGLALSVGDYATLMITVSDNTATNMLIDRVGGVDPVNRFVRDQLGLATVTLHRKVSFPVAATGRGDTREPRPLLGEASPRHLMELASLIWRRRLVSAQASEAMLAILGRQQFLDQVPRFLDCDVLASQSDPPPGILVACKTGMVGSIRAEAGVLLLRGRAVSYAVMTNGAADTTLHADHEGMLTNAAVGRVVAERFWPGPGPAPLRPQGTRQRPATTQPGRGDGVR